MSESNERLGRQLVAISQELGVVYTLRGDSVDTDKVFASDGLLPSFLKRAEQLSNFCFGYGLGVSYEQQSSAIVGSTVKLDDKTPSSLRLLCLTDVIVEMMQNASDSKKISLDELVLDGAPL